MIAYSTKIEWEENGCWLVIETTEDEHALRFSVQDPEALYDAVKAGVLPWLMERDEALRSRPEPVYDAAEAYDLMDPKHPRYHSVHADLWDSREGK